MDNTTTPAAPTIAVGRLGAQIADALATGGFTNAHGGYDFAIRRDAPTSARRGSLLRIARDDNVIFIYVLTVNGVLLFDANFAAHTPTEAIVAYVKSLVTSLEARR